MLDWKKVILALVCLGALSACGADDEPECTGPSCGGTAATPDAGNTTTPSSVTGDAAAAATGDAGGNVTPPAQTMEAGMARAEAGTANATDASAPMKDAAEPPTPAGDGGTGNVNKPPPKPSAGCGMAAPMAGNGTIDVNGTMRSYIVTLPQSYDPMKPHRLIFAWHGLGGTAASIAQRGYYGLQTRAQNSAIFVTGQGLDTMALGMTAPGWDNMGGRDVNFVKALYARLQSTLCIDENRVFSTGMSYGGIMSNTLGCQMGDVFRAIAPMAGSGPGFGGRATCTGEVAVWMSHGDNDTVVATSSGMASRDFWVRTNKCQETSKPVEPSPCVSYDGCAADLPVTFCLFPGGHTVPAFAAAAIWDFFAMF
jgi:polyhydroxybutyrate depolymerase